MNAVAPTMLSSSKLPHPSFPCWWPSSPSAARSAAYSARLSPFMIRCCQSMLTLTLSRPSARSLWITCSVIPMLRIRIFIAGSEFLCSRKTVMPRSRACPAASRMPSRNRAHDSGPDDHLRADVGREVDRREREAERLVTCRVVRRTERPLCEPGVEVQPARDAVDPVAVERGRDALEVRPREL